MFRPGLPQFPPSKLSQPASKPSQPASKLGQPPSELSQPPSEQSSSYNSGAVGKQSVCPTTHTAYILVLMVHNSLRGSGHCQSHLRCVDTCGVGT